MRLLFLLLFFISLNSIQVMATPYFKDFGKISHIEYKPPSSPLSFKYDVLYYLPKSIQKTKNYPAIVFLHGGGASTKTRSSSLDNAKTYANKFIKFADENGVAMIFPSGSGLNWGSHLVSYLKDLNKTLTTELPINPNKIALTGHSMGAMGISRSAIWLADQYSFFMPVAGYLSGELQTEQNLMPFFNIKYYQMVGVDDRNNIVSHAKLQKFNISKLEKKINQKTGYVLELYHQSHNIPMEFYLGELKKYLNFSRDMYQKNLSGLFLYEKQSSTDRFLKGAYHIAPKDHYFWLKAISFNRKNKLINVNAEIKNNKIKIMIDQGVAKLRVYLSYNNLNFKVRIVINVNGINHFNDYIKNIKSNVSDNKNYQRYIDIDLT